MKNMKTKMLLLVASFLVGAAAQSVPVGAPIPADMAQFFIGGWACKGKLASGKELDATLRFSSALHGQALEFEHRDTPPSPYHALALWTLDRTTGKLVAFMQDNGGGTRLFTGDGWKDGKVTLTDIAILGHKPFAERFRFERQGANTLAMYWEVKTPAGAWRLGDSTVCQRDPGARIEP